MSAAWPCVAFPNCLRMYRTNGRIICFLPHRRALTASCLCSSCSRPQQASISSRGRGSARYVQIPTLQCVECGRCGTVRRFRRGRAGGARAVRPAAIFGLRPPPLLEDRYLKEQTSETSDWIFAAVLHMKKISGHCLYVHIVPYSTY